MQHRNSDQRPLTLPGWLRWTGVGPGAIAVSLLAWTLRSLGRDLTGTVKVRAAPTPRPAQLIGAVQLLRADGGPAAFLTLIFLVATLKNAFRVRSSQGQGQPSKTRRLPGPGRRARLGCSVGLGRRFEYSEIRIIALAPKTGILYCVAFVDRGEVRRIISLRRANRREVKHYVQSH